MSKPQHGYMTRSKISLVSDQRNDCEGSTAGSNRQLSQNGMTSQFRSSQGMSNVSHSSKIRNEKAEYDAKLELSKLNEEESGLREKMEEIDFNLKHLQDLINEKQTKLSVGSLLSTEDKELLRFDIQSHEDTYRTQQHQRGLQKIREASQLKLISEKRDLVYQKLKLEKGIILEDADQFLGSDEDSDSVNSLGIRQVTNPTERDEDHTLEAEYEKLQKAIKIQSLATAAEELKRQEAAERDMKIAELLKRQVKAKVEKDRQAAEAARQEAELEAEMIMLTKVEEVTIPEDRRPASPTTATADERLIEVFARAIERSSGQQPIRPDNNSRFLARQSHAKELPYFSGKPEEWLTFYADFKRSTEDCGFSNSENMSRLRKCLRGEAARYVQCQMISPENVPNIIRDLETRYGQAEHIIEAMIMKAKGIPAFKGEQLDGFLEFGIAVRNVSATIKSLNRQDYLCNPQLYKELESKLPTSFKVQWLNWVNTDKTRLKDLIHFTEWLDEQTTLFCSVCPPKAETVDKKDSGFQDRRWNPRNRRSGEHAMITEEKVNQHKLESDLKERKCVFCSQIGHRIQQCSKFKENDVSTRHNYVKQKGLCYSCLNYGHRTNVCRSKKVCGKDGCKREHHQLLHIVQRSEPPRKNAENVNIAKPIQPTQGDEESCGFANQQLKRIADPEIGTWILPCKLEGPNGVISTFVMLDSGASVSLIQTGMAKSLGLEGKEEILGLAGINNTAYMTSQTVSLTIHREDGKGWFPLVGLKTVDRLPLPKETIRKELLEGWNHLKDLNIPSLSGAQPTILLGIKHHARFVTPLAIVNGPLDSPFAIKTRLGWTLGGREDDLPNDGFAYFTNAISNEQLHHNMKETFMTENIGAQFKTPTLRSKDDKRAQEILDATLKVNGSNTECGLLWKDEDVPRPDGYSQAFKRLQQMEKKMDANPEFAKLYLAKIEEYQSKGYAKELTAPEVQNGGSRVYYLPHFMNYNPKKPGKLRFVFDCAATVDGISLNDRLLKGPDKLRPLPSVLHKFRQKKIALVGDIEDMFHRVKVRKEDVSVQRFLWRGMERNKAPKIMEMGVLIFGAACSPVCAIEALNKNTDRFKDKYPEAVHAIVNCTYMDDYGDSVDTVLQAVKRRQQIQEIHAAGGSLIHKWGSNSREVLESIPSELRAIGMKELKIDSEMAMERILGLFWKPDEDIFTFALKFLKIDPSLMSGLRAPTKKELLSLAMSIYDPLGFMAHFTIKARIIIQDTWRHETKWEDEIPEECHDKWKQWLEELKNIPSFQLPRCYSPNWSTADNLQLHIFCDASQLAYGVVAYFRVEKDGVINTCFITAKAKVSPLKCLSIPRLELQGAVIGSRLSGYLKESHDVKVHRTVYWTDSKCVYHWIQADGKRFPPFVSHRIGEVQENSDALEWNWVPGKDNVADELTREDPSNWKQDSRWLNGPSFLMLPEEEWPKDKPKEVDISIKDLELKKDFVFMLLMQQPIQIDIARYSSWSKAVHVRAYIQRCITFCKSKKGERTVLSHKLFPQEIRDAEEWWWLQIQMESYPKEIECLKDGQDLEKDSLILKLNPFLDGNKVLRVNGRLENANIPFEMKYPVILPPKHYATHLLIQHYHIRGGHHGHERVINEIKQRYFIPKLRTTAMTVRNNCQHCKNQKVQPIVPQMGQLPPHRLKSYGAPFDNTGVDYFGPIEVSVGRRHEKRYGVLFTCLSTRAVHLEVAHSLSTDSCILAIRKFICRRGCPQHLYSDNGTNFVGANNELKALNQDQLTGECTSKGITWHFNPPAAPHMGGSWERLVRSVKVALYATLKQTFPKDEVFQALMIEAEHVVNSHPLTHVSMDPDDDVALTPNHFLIGRSSYVNPFAVSEEIVKNPREMWKQNEKLADLFWHRWTKEYLPTLQKRTKWHRPSEPVKVGDVVLVMNDNEPRGSWPKGVVKKVFPGLDGKVRVVLVETAKNIYKRPVVKIIVLDVRTEHPILEEEAEAVAIVVKTTDNNHFKRLELPQESAKLLGLMTLRQELDFLKISGWYKKKLNEYLVTFKAKRHRMRAGNK